MIYAVSDLHGCYDRYRQLLDKLEFNYLILKNH